MPMESQQQGRIKIGYEIDQIWTATIKKEELTSESWKQRWSWIVDEYSNMQQDLHELKKYRPRSSQRSTAELRTVGEFPVTTYGEIGWLVTKPEFHLEIYGPNIKKIPLEPPKQEPSLKSTSNRTKISY